MASIAQTREVAEEINWLGPFDAVIQWIFIFSTRAKVALYLVLSDRAEARLGDEAQFASLGHELGAKSRPAKHPGSPRLG
jgi:hypothetical protein